MPAVAPPAMTCDPTRRDHQRAAYLTVGWLFDDDIVSALSKAALRLPESAMEEIIDATVADAGLDASPNGKPILRAMVAYVRRRDDEQINSPT